LITIHTTEIWTENSFEDIAEKIRSETHLVQFGPFNIYGPQWKQFSAKWIGQIFKEKKQFKLFRLTGSDTTSDLSINGEYTNRGARPIIVIKHKLHFTAVLGLAGLLTCIYALWFLLLKKGVVEGVLWLLLPLVIAGVGYSGFTIRDLNKNIAEIERLMQKPVIIPVWNNRHEEMDDEEDEDEDIDDWQTNGRG
jgi:hypothetical protein